MKEELCFVSKNFTSDMKISSFKNENNINIREFILPEYRNKSAEDLKKIQRDRYRIEVNSLRFITPEILFNPSLIGIEEGGLQEGIAQAIKDCHPDYKNLMYENIILTGGNCKLQNFTERLNHELIPNSDYDSEIKIFNMSNTKYSEAPILGMKHFSNDRESLIENSITKSEYEEVGFNIFWKTSI